MTKPIIVVKVPCKLLYIIQVKEFLIKCSTSWPYLISEFLVAYITIVASDWPRAFFTPKVFLFSLTVTWERNGKQYNSGNVENTVHNNGVSSNLTINMATVRDSGKYRCRAINVNGNSTVSTEAELISKLFYRLH